MISADPDTTWLPSGEKVTEYTWPECPFSSASDSPVATFQMCTVPSDDPDTTQLPSGEKTTDVTPPKCPLSSALESPVATFQIRTVWPHDPETTWLPSGEKPTEYTASECSFSSDDSPVTTFQMCTVLLPVPDPDTICVRGPLVRSYL